MQFTLYKTDEGTSFVTVFVAGRKPATADDTHPNWDAILDGLMDADDSIIDLFDVSQTVSNKFERLSERVTVANGRIYLDGDEIDNALTKQVIDFLDAGVEDVKWKSLVRFFENVQANENEHSKEQLYRWLNTHNIAINPEGLIVGYKGVARDGNGGYVSIMSGKAMVDGEVKEGNIPNPIGAVIEMPRSEVHHDPAVGCHQGLHVGTYDYARGFSQAGVLEVHVNPRDVVSVPTDSGDAKMRVCRYTVVQEIDAPYTTPLVNDTTYDWGEWDEDEVEVEPRGEWDLTFPVFYPDLNVNTSDYEVTTNVTSVDGVSVGDKYEDKDSRTYSAFFGPRILTVTGFDVDKAIVLDNRNGTTTKIKVSRLLKPWKFRKV